MLLSKYMEQQLSPVTKMLPENALAIRPCNYGALAQSRSFSKLPIAYSSVIAYGPFSLLRRALVAINNNLFFFTPKIF